jgi:hypothetical protein
MNWRYISSDAAASIVIAPLLLAISTEAGAFRLLSTQTIRGTVYRHNDL